MHASPRQVVAGVFVGGRASRMGGYPKGLLVLPSGVTLVQRWCALFDELGVPCVLVGANALYESPSASASQGLSRISDAGAGGDLGPLGGVLALLEHAGPGRAIAVACDMPFVSLALARRLLEAPPAAAVAPRREGRWEPFFSRYDAAVVKPIADAHARAGTRSLQALLDAAGAVPLSLSREESRELRDWDTVEDAASDGASVPTSKTPAPT